MLWRSNFVYAMETSTAKLTRTYAQPQTSSSRAKMPTCATTYQKNTCAKLTNKQFEVVAHGTSQKTEQPSPCRQQFADVKEIGSVGSSCTPDLRMEQQLACAYQSRYVSVKLRRDGLWKMFHKTGTEMILTKNGRRMFPILDFTLTGLDPDQYYTCAVELVRSDGCRYRYHAMRGWGKAGVNPTKDRQRSYYEHPNSASLGRLWLSKGACFDKLRLTNHLMPGSENLLLGSMLKYHARFVLTKLTMGSGEQWSFDFPETSFIAVTSYQNPHMTKLKIDNNPFAKAFRDGKRKTHSGNPPKAVKKRRTRFPSPPPITRYQSPFIAYLSRQDSTEPSDALSATSTPAPSPPTSEYFPSNCLSIENEPFPWEQTESFNYCNTLPKVSHSYSVSGDASYFKHEHQPTGQQFHFEAPMEPEFPPCQMAPQHNWHGAGYGLFEDVQLLPFDGYQWREN